jgi:hypothetical protein
MKPAKHGTDGVICGHIHHAANEMRGGIRYINTGDWVESCTAIVEHDDGRIELIDWSRRIAGQPGLTPQSETAAKSCQLPMRPPDGPLFELPDPGLHPRHHHRNQPRIISWS